MVVKNATRIVSTDFDGFISDIAANIWNDLLIAPVFRDLKPADFAQLFDILNRNLAFYRGAEMKRTALYVGHSKGIARM